MMVKYIVFDLDDTLLNSEREVSAFTLSTLKKLQKLGHFLIINTARSKMYAKEYIDLIKPDYAILNGGSLIIDKEYNVIYKNAITSELSNKVIKELLAISSTISVQTENILYSSSEYKAQNAVVFDFINDIFKEESFKILSCSSLDEKVFEIAKKYNLECVSYFSGDWKRINAKGSSKWNGVKELMRIINGDINNVITFGDDVGDLEMIENASVGVLMKNSRDEIKKDTICISKYSNDEDGVAKFLIEYLLKN